MPFMCCYESCAQVFNVEYWVIASIMSSKASDLDMHFYSLSVFFDIKNTHIEISLIRFFHSSAVT